MQSAPSPAIPALDQAERSALKKKTLAGLSWSALTQVSQQGLRFGVAVVLARILSPTEFGLVAMLAVFTGFARLFTDLGFGASLIQKKDLRPEHLDTVFWLNGATGLVLAGVVAALAPLIARFYNQPLLVGLTIATGFNFLLTSLNVVQTSLLQKTMNFRRLFWIDLSAMAIGGTVGIILAVSGFGAWSLVLETLAISFASVCAMWMLSGWRPRFRFDKGALRELYKFSGNLLAFNAVSYWSRNFDALLIGKVMGSAPAGIYHRAYQLMLLPLAQVTSVVTRVMFPALASIHEDIPRVRSVYLRATRIISLATFPIMLGLMVLAEPTILLVYGEKWREVIPIFQILCFTGIVQSIGTTISWIYMSQGRTDIQLRWGLIATTIRVVAFLIGIRWGLVGVAVAYVVSGYLLIWYPAWSIAGRLIGLTFWKMIGNLVPTFLCAAAMALLVWTVDWTLLAQRPHYLRVAVGVALGGVSYFALASAFRIAPLMDLLELARIDRFRETRWGQPLLRFLPSVSATKT